MWKKISLAMVAAVAGLLIYAASLPDRFTLQRSVVIGVPANRLFPLVNDLRGFNTWNPVARQDPGIKIRYEGPASGPGAAYSWKGAKSGAGRMEITDTLPDARVTMRLQFSEPYTTTNMVDFTLQPQGGQTRLTWAMHGPMPFAARLLTPFYDMDRRVGQQFEQGLSNLKTLAEKMHPTDKP